jgi:hypothetical protein
MATREVRGIQIALLLLTGVTVTLGVTTYGLFQRSETLQAEMLSHRRAAQQQQELAEIAQHDNHLLKQIIGHAGVTLINPTIENARLDDATMVSHSSYRHIIAIRWHVSPRWSVGRRPQKRWPKIVPPKSSGKSSRFKAA